MKELDNLRNAFPAMPEECRTALSSAARSVKEEEPLKRKYPVVILVAAILTLMTTIAIAEGWNVLAFLGIQPDSDAQTLVQPVSVSASAGNVTLHIDSAITDGEYLAFDWTVTNHTPETPAYLVVEEFTANGKPVWTDGTDDFHCQWLPGWCNDGTMIDGNLTELPELSGRKLRVQMRIGVYTPTKPVYLMDRFSPDIAEAKRNEGYYIIAAGDGIVIDHPEEGLMQVFGQINALTGTDLDRSEITVQFDLDLNAARAAVRELPLPEPITQSSVTLTFLSATATPLQTHLTASVSCESGSKDTILHWAHRDEFVLTDAAGNELFLWDLCAQYLGETTVEQASDGSWFRSWTCTIIDPTAAMPKDVLLSYRLDEQAHLEDGTPLPEGLRIDLPITLK